MYNKRIPFEGYVQTAKKFKGENLMPKIISI